MNTNSKQEDVTSISKEVDVVENPTILESNLVNGTRNSRRKSITELRRLSQTNRNSEKQSTQSAEINREELREMLDLKNYHEYFREFMTIWKHTLARKTGVISHGIVDCLNEDETKTETSPNGVNNNNNTNKEEIGKHILFWLSSCVSRINEPFHLLRELEKMKEAGINGKNLDQILALILKHLSQHKLFDFKTKEIYEEICSQLLILFNPPNCEKCSTQFMLMIPKDVKPNKVQNPFHGFVYDKQSRNDSIPVCDSCQQRLILEDVYFQCPQCGPNEVIRVIRGGRLKNVVKKSTTGCTICV